MTEQQLSFILDFLAFFCGLLADEDHQYSVFIGYMRLFSVYAVLGEDSLYIMSISLL